jgi:hypothetical protein
VPQERVDEEATTYVPGSFPHDLYSEVTLEFQRRIEPNAIVSDSQKQVLVLNEKVNVNLVRLGMSQSVAKGFFCDLIQGELNGRLYVDVLDVGDNVSDRLTLALSDEASKRWGQPSSSKRRLPQVADQ